MTSNNKFSKKFFRKAAGAILAAILAFSVSSPSFAALKTKEEIPEFLGIKEWRSHTGPLRRKNALGAVLLIHFSSFTDLRSLYKAETLINWQSKYYVYGFRVVHILTPEFSFETKIAVPEQLSKKGGVTYPVALDSRKTMWQAYGNPEKPMDFLVDSRGRIRHKFPADSTFEAEEKIIHLLLKEKDPEFENELETYPAPRIPAVKNFSLGYKKGLQLGNPEKMLSEVRQKFKIPDGELVPERVYLSGYWKLTDEAAETAQGGAELRFAWDGSPLFILGGIDRDSPTPVEAIIEGPSAVTEKLRGADLVQQGDGFYVLLQQNKIYAVTKRLPAGKYSLTLRFPEAGTKIYRLSFPEKQSG